VLDRPAHISSQEDGSEDTDQEGRHHGQADPVARRLQGLVDQEIGDLL